MLRLAWEDLKAYASPVLTLTRSSVETAACQMPGPQRPEELENCLDASHRGFASEMVFRIWIRCIRCSARQAETACRTSAALLQAVGSRAMSGSLAACPDRRSRPGPDQDAPKATSIKSCIGSLSVATRRLPRQGKKLQAERMGPSFQPGPHEILALLKLQAGSKCAQSRVMARHFKDPNLLGPQASSHPQHSSFWFRALLPNWPWVRMEGTPQDKGTPAARSEAFRATLRPRRALCGMWSDVGSVLLTS